MPGTVKSELLPDADRSHKCDCQEKVSWKRNLPLDKSHFITEMEINQILSDLSSFISSKDELNKYLNWFYRPTGVSATAAVEKTEEAVAEASLFSDGSTPTFTDSAETAPTVTAEPQTETTTVPETEEVIVESEQTEAVQTPEVQETEPVVETPAQTEAAPVVTEEPALL